MLALGPLINARRASQGAGEHNRRPAELAEGDCTYFVMLILGLGYQAAHDFRAESSATSVEHAPCAEGAVTFGLDTRQPTGF